MLPLSGLQDNPWACDCRISKLIELSKMTETSVVLLDQLLACSGPEKLAGVLLSRVQLDRCVKPTVMTSATKITSPLGSNVLLRCDATGLPTPSLIWTRSGGPPVNSTGNIRERVHSFSCNTKLYRQPFDCLYAIASSDVHQANFVAFGVILMTRDTIFPGFSGHVFFLGPCPGIRVVFQNLAV